MNTVILLMLLLVLFDLLDCQREEVLDNFLCFLSGLCFGHFVANTNKSRGLAKQFTDNLIFFVQNYNTRNKVDYFKNLVR